MTLAKGERDHQLVISSQFKSQCGMAWGALVNMAWAAWTSVKALLMLIHILYTGFGASCCHQTMAFSGKALLILVRQFQTTFCIYYNSMALQ